MDRNREATTTESITRTIESSIHRYHVLFIKHKTKDRIKIKYNSSIPSSKDITTINKIKSVECIFDIANNAHINKSVLELSQEKEESYKSRLARGTCNNIISNEWLDISNLNSNDMRNQYASLWKEVNEFNGDSFYTCFVYLLFTKVVFANEDNFNKIEFDILNNFKKEFKDLSFNQTIFVFKHRKELSSESKFSKAFNVFSEFVREMKLYVRYCISRCVKKQCMMQFDYFLEEGTEPYPKEKIFEILAKFFRIKLFIKNKDGLCPYEANNQIQFDIFHFGGRYHLYSNENSNENVASFPEQSNIHGNLIPKTDHMIVANNQMCECGNPNYSIVYVSIYSSFICENCLREHIDKVMTNRYKSYVKNNINKEMYLSPIYVNDETSFRDMILSKVLGFDKTKYESYLSFRFDDLSKTLKYCQQCKSFDNSSDLKKYKCDCLFDENCLKTIIEQKILNLKTTHQDFFLKTTTIKLNNDELIELEFKCDFCNKLYFDNSENILTETFKRNARKTFMNYCISCGNNFTLVNEISNWKCIIEDNSIHKKLFPSYYHFLCTTCYSNYSTSIKCSFCNQTHSIRAEELEKIHKLKRVKKRFSN